MSFLRRTLACAAVGAVLVLPSCSNDVAGSPQPRDAAHDSAPPTPVTPSTMITTPTPTPQRSRPTHRPQRSAPAPTPTTTGRAAAQLPLGGRTILPRLRVVAFYGGPDGPTLGVLGSAPPDQIVHRIADQAQRYARFGRPVQPAMELIADVAQASPGPDDHYSARISNADIASYLAAAHAAGMLLILDIQPGSGDFLPDVKMLRRFLLDPSVSIALDPEWKVPPGEAPGGGRIGSASAASINAVSRYLSRLVRRHKLPDKLFIVHEFSLTMLPDRQDIVQRPGLELVFHADGEGAPASKVAVYRQLHFPGPPIGSGFKLFFTEDTRLMTPARVMRLTPQPDIITYQ